MLNLRHFSKHRMSIILTILVILVVAFCLNLYFLRDGRLNQNNEMANVEDGKITRNKIPSTNKSSLNNSEKIVVKTQESTESEKQRKDESQIAKEQEKGNIQNQTGQTGYDINKILGPIWKYVQNGEYDKAMEEYKRIADLYAGTEIGVEALWRWSSVYIEMYHQGKRPEQIPILQRIVDEYPDHRVAPMALLDIAAIYDTAGDKESAAKENERLLSKYPQSEQAPGAAIRLAHQYDDMKRYNDAYIVINKMIETYPNSEHIPEAKNFLDYLVRNKIR